MDITMATFIWPIMESISHDLLNRKIPSSEGYIVIILCVWTINCYDISIFVNVKL
jgi:hypothetical protein